VYNISLRVTKLLM